MFVTTNRMTTASSITISDTTFLDSFVSPAFRPIQIDVGVEVVLCYNDLMRLCSREVVAA
jgi:hypothetical protein